MGILIAVSLLLFLFLLAFLVGRFVKPPADLTEYDNPRNTDDLMKAAQEEAERQYKNSLKKGRINII